MGPQYTEGSSTTSGVMPGVEAAAAPPPGTEASFPAPAAAAAGSNATEAAAAAAAAAAGSSSGGGSEPDGSDGCDAADLTWLEYAIVQPNTSARISVIKWQVWRGCG